jgi:hypothetical protein
MKRRPVSGRCSLFLLVTFFLSGCAQTTKTSPEALVLSILLGSPNKVPPSSILFLREQSLLEHTFVLVQYHVEKSNGEILDCHALFDTFLDDQNRWTTSGGDPSCSPQGRTELQPSWGAYGMGSLAKPAGMIYSYIYGHVWNNDIASMVITWEDGTQQVVDLNQNTYLALREGRSSRIEVAGKDKSGKIIYTESFAPGE